MLRTYAPFYGLGRGAPGQQRVVDGRRAFKLSGELSFGTARRSANGFDCTGDSTAIPITGGATHGH
jgi:hypothetical protein